MSGLFDRWLASMEAAPPTATTEAAGAAESADTAEAASAEATVPAEATTASASDAPTARERRQPRRPAAIVLDTVLAEAVDVARAAITEVAGESEVGAHLGAVAEDTRLVTHSFECTNPAYRGWHWVAVLARAPRAKKATVCETALLPGADALVAPAWEPWEERVRPGDMRPKDVLPKAEDDPNLDLGLEQVDLRPGDDIDQVPNFEYGLGRTRVLSREGIANAAQRWVESDAGPDGAVRPRGPQPVLDLRLPPAHRLETAHPLRRVREQVGALRRAHRGARRRVRCSFGDGCAAPLLGAREVRRRRLRRIARPRRECGSTDCGSTA